MEKPLQRIDVDFLAEIQWQSHKTNYNLLANDVHIWKITVDQFCALFQEFRSILSSQELNKAKQFFKEQDFKRYLTGRILLRLLLSKHLSIPAALVQFDFSSKKPAISDKNALKFNLSYSDEFVIIAIGNCQSGVDIEKLKIYFDYNNLLTPCFSTAEIVDIEQNETKSMNTFFLHWTRKEALLKYTGQGIIDNLIKIPSLDGTHFLNNDYLKINENIKLQSFFLDQTCIGSIAYPSSISKVSFFEWGDTSTLYQQTHDNS